MPQKDRTLDQTKMNCSPLVHGGARGGLHHQIKSISDNVWMWSDGSPFTFTSWGRGEPNNYRGQKEPCMEIRNAGSGYVNDEPCQRRSAFICAKNA
ncbi:unnamed protein product [Menidia menidia]|uniref:(Atlantic silverside) hypothetical protein n=1 Tax=Menidia menidia TaxID=238744 RepID=A0A8S4B908_9TELE|nr:unnamed protein product [Menidia menidia]